MRQFIFLIGKAIYFVLTLGRANGESFSRFGMYESIRRELAKRQLKFAGSALSISWSHHLLEVMDAKTVFVLESNYPDQNILALPYADETFDLVVSDQVFEHIDGWPSDAMRETLRVLRPGGWVLHTTCYHTAWHGPGDYWRWTIEGIGSMAERCGAAEVIAGGSGHPMDLISTLLGWTRLPVPLAKWHPLRWLAELNHPAYANAIWVLARK
jgi:SAM-dependent methyltransferase